MQKLFIGKFTVKDQYENNYYKIDDEKDKGVFSSLSEGDYVLPSHGTYVGKLLKFKGFEEKQESIHATFDVVKTYPKDLTYAGNITNCKYFVPDMNLWNKTVKSTKGLGFFEISLEKNCPEIPDIDFENSQRKFIIVLEEAMNSLTFVKPQDICIIISSLKEGRIKDILEFNGKSFERHEATWTLYQDKIEHGKSEYTLHELLDYAKPTKDNSPKKYKYILSLIGALESEKYFIADNAVALYDNVIVGRKKTYVKPKTGVKTPTDVVDPDESNDLSEYETYAKLLELNPNIILYGPPGTGKTYGSMKIIEAFEEKLGYKSSFHQVKDEGRLRFITFHQAFSYEEFVEGLRPVTDEAGNIKYDIKPGVLKRLAEDCRVEEKKQIFQKEALAHTTGESKVWKVSLGRKNIEEDVYERLRDLNQIAIGSAPTESIEEWTDEVIDGTDPSGMLKTLRSKMQIGDLVFIFNSLRTIRLIGVVVSDYLYVDDGIKYRHRRKVEWIGNFEKNPVDIYNLNQEKQMTLSSLYELKISAADALKLIEDEDDVETPVKPYYLIIDEINRGNIAKVFGELITLIEKDKREVLSCHLPYSSQEFTLPKNLYIIGTMNTSDRSIALLDTALRRRFAFVEVNPDPKLIESVSPTVGGNVSPSKLLTALNQRIVEKIDRDHRIGHSYFMGEDLITKEDLHYVWYYKIIPLLMEYFYNDISQVEDIVGSKFINKKTGEISLLGLAPNNIGVSEFESALMDIYGKEFQG